MNKWYMRWTYFIGVALICLSVVAFFFAYTADEIEGWVIDSNTGQPIEGVIVLAHWQLRGGFTNKPLQELKVFEDVTDSKGRYFFPAWGPKFAFLGSLDSRSPAVYMFKPGFEVLVINNTSADGWGYTRFSYNKKSIKMQRFTGTLAEYASKLSWLSDDLEHIGLLYDSLCGWQSFPTMVRALDKQETELRQAGVIYSLLATRMKSMESRFTSANCSVEHFLAKQ